MCWSGVCCEHTGLLLLLLGPCMPGPHTLTTSVQCREVRASVGTVVKPIWLLITTWMVPPTLYPVRQDASTISRPGFTGPPNGDEQYFVHAAAAQLTQGSSTINPKHCPGGDRHASASACVASTACRLRYRGPLYMDQQDSIMQPGQLAAWQLVCLDR